MGSFILLPSLSAPLSRIVSRCRYLLEFFFSSLFFYVGHLCIIQRSSFMDLFSCFATFAQSPLPLAYQYLVRHEPRLWPSSLLVFCCRLTDKRVPPSASSLSMSVFFRFPSPLSSWLPISFCWLLFPWVLHLNARASQHLWLRLTPLYEVSSLIFFSFLFR